MSEIMPVRIAALMTCYNRRAMTLACIESIVKQFEAMSEEFGIFLMDDGSTDGTANEVRRRFPSVKILQGNGSLYWNGGMRSVFSAALKEGFDFYLWLNDDMLPDQDTIASLVGAYRILESRGEKAPIVVGSTRDESTTQPTYGGLLRSSWVNPLKFRLLHPTSEVQRCDTFQGNCVLISRAAADRLGNLDEAFTHASGDTDYGLRAWKSGCSVWVAPNTVGICSPNRQHRIKSTRGLPFRERWRAIVHPKGLPPREWKVLTQRHAGLFWPIFWISPYARLVVECLTDSLRHCLLRRPIPLKNAADVRRRIP